MRRTSQFGAFISFCTDLAALRAESNQNVAKPPAGARVLLAREHFGERRDDRGAGGVADPLESFVAFVAGPAQLRGDVLHHRAAAKLLECRSRVRLTIGIARPHRSATASASSHA